MKSRPKFPNLETFDFCPSAPSTTKRIYIFSAGANLPASQIHKLNLTISFQFQNDPQRGLHSFPNSYTPHSYIYTRNHLCNWSSSVPFNSNRITKCIKFSQLLHKQHKAPMYSVNLTFDKKAYKQKEILLAQPNQIKYFSRKELPAKKNISIIPFPSSRFKYYTLPSLSTFKNLKSLKLPQSLTHNLSLHLSEFPVSDYVTLPYFSNRFSNSFPHISYLPNYIRNFNTLRHLAFSLPEPEMKLLSSNPLEIATNHIEDHLYMSRIQWKDIIANKLYILGISNFRPITFQGRFLSTRATSSKNYISSHSNNECYLHSPIVFDSSFFSSSIPKPYIAPIFQPSDLSPLDGVQACQKESLQSLVPFNVPIESFADNRLAFNCTNSSNSTDVDESPIPFQYSQPPTYVIDERSTKRYESTSLTNPIIPPGRNSNLAMNDRMPGSGEQNVDQAKKQEFFISPSLPHFHSSPTYNSRSNYDETYSVPPYHNLPNTSMSNLMTAEFPENENEMLSDDTCNILDSHKPNFAAKYDEFLQTLKPPCNWQVSIDQSSKNVKHSTESCSPVIYSKVSKSLRHPTFLTDCDVEYMEIKQNNSKIQLDSFLRGTHGITDGDFSSSMITLHKVIEESHLLAQDGERLIPDNMDICIDPVIINDPPPIPSMTKFMKRTFPNFNEINTIEHSMDGNTATRLQNTMNSKIESYFPPIVNRPLTRNLECNPSRATSNPRNFTFVGNNSRFNPNVRKVMDNQTIQGYKYRSSRQGLTDLFNITQAYTYSYYVDANSNDIDT